MLIAPEQAGQYVVNYGCFNSVMRCEEDTVAREVEVIEREIEYARDALAATIDQLSTRPQKMVENGKATLRAKFAEPKVRYTLIAAGAVVGLLVVRRLFR